MRNAFCDALTAVAAQRDDMVLLVGDIGFGVFEPFIERHPTRYFNLGIAEANMIGVSAGLALNGQLPIVYTIVPFLVMRPFEHVRVDLSIQNLKVILVGVGGGLAYGSLGPTHHSIEDLGLMCSLPHFAVFAPGDPSESGAAFHAALAHPGPCYIRLGRNGEQDLARHGPKPLGKGIRKFGDENPDLAIFCVGPLTEEALHAAADLRERGWRLAVLSVSQLKPLPTDILLREIAASKRVAVVDEHTVMSGLAPALALEMAKSGHTRPLLVRGIEDCITKIIGSRDYLLRHHGLDRHSLVLAFDKFLQS